MNRILLALLIILSIFISNSAAQVEKTVHVEYFYDPACQKCAKATPIIDKVVNEYGNKVAFDKYNVKDEIGLQEARKYRIPGVPAVVIDNTILISYEDYGSDLEKLETLLKNKIEEAFIQSPTTRNTTASPSSLSFLSVFTVGFLAGFNPCLFAILAFIASVALVSTGKRRNVLYIVAAFSLGIFVTYFIVGLGLFKLFESSAMQDTIRTVVVGVISILGIWHVYDAYHLRKNTESTFYTPKFFVRMTENITKKVNLPASFLMGSLFSLIKAPCVGAVYLVILDMVRNSSERGLGLMYLGVYNLGVILPVLVIGIAIAFGLNPEKVEKFRKEKRSALRLITGLSLLIIAVLMYLNII
ncbi:MAG: cytochrome c biogenesis protein CcdA [Nitrospirota bacterium]|nr:cytochrome c biogenesis protein CcdA [Nitrospirota bacterium]